MGHPDASFKAPAADRRRPSNASSRGTPVNSSRPLIAMAGVDITRYFTATAAFAATSISSTWISDTWLFAFSITVATNALAV